MPSVSHRAVLQAACLGLLWACARGAQADFGYANSRCEHWLNPEKADQAPARRQWVLGYLTATMRFSEEYDLSTVDQSQAIAELRAYCKDHPRTSLETATQEAILSNLPDDPY